MYIHNFLHNFVRSMFITLLNLVSFKYGAVWDAVCSRRFPCKYAFDVAAPFSQAVLGRRGVEVESALSASRDGQVSAVPPLSRRLRTGADTDRPTVAAETKDTKAAHWRRRRRLARGQPSQPRALGSAARPVNTWAADEPAGCQRTAAASAAAAARLGVGRSGCGRESCSELAPAAWRVRRSWPVER